MKRFELENREFAKEYPDQLRGRINSGGINVQTVAITGKVVESITNYAAKNEVDLIAIATHGRSEISRWAQGSVADRISPVCLRTGFNGARPGVCTRHLRITKKGAKK